MKDIIYRVLHIKKVLRFYFMKYKKYKSGCKLYQCYKESEELWKDNFAYVDVTWDWKIWNLNFYASPYRKIATSKNISHLDA